MSFETQVDYTGFKLIRVSVEGAVANLRLFNPSRKNAIGAQLRQEVGRCLALLSIDSTVRAVVLTAEGNVFSSGIDLQELQSLSEAQKGAVGKLDAGRKALLLGESIRSFQDFVTAFEKCSKPIIAAVHGACIGAGIDVITACDIRFCSKQAVFSVREAKMGLAADVGTLQRLPKVVGCDSWVRDLAFTGRDFGADEALKFGLVQEVLDTAELVESRALALAKQIASNSPLAVMGTKASLNYSRDHSVAEGLEHVALLNHAFLQAPDIVLAAMAFIQKSQASFPDLPRVSKL